MKKIVVIGGGFVGQLVQFAIPDAVVLDGRPTAPRDHLDTRVGPQYLWEPIPGCESESFTVTTLVDSAEPNPDSILAYKRKIGKERDGGNWGLQFQHEMTGWTSKLPPPRIQYDRKLHMVDLVNKQIGLSNWTTMEYDILVVTIPMPTFLETLILGPNYDHPFRWDPIYMVEEPFGSPTEGMVLNYRSKLDDPWYRDTIFKDMRYYESLQKMEATAEMHKRLRILNIGKIHTHRQSEQIIAELIPYDCFCFGRFATWRPDELAHETWKHIVNWKEVFEL